MNEARSPNDQQQMFAAGYLHGVVDGVSAWSRIAECVPAEVQYGTLERVVLRWGDVNVTKQHLNASIAIVMAIRDAYCTAPPVVEKK